MTMVTLDTNVIIYYFKKETEVVSVLNDIFSLQSRPFIASVTELELLSSPTLTPVEVAEIDGLLLSLSIIPLDSQVARRAAEIRRMCRLKTADSVIAATALFTHSTLLTRNIKDFKKIPDLAVQSV